MRWFVLLGMLAGCGRIGFGAGESGAVDGAVDGTSADGPRVDARVCAMVGNDDDGDGLTDDCDPCPHLAGTAADADGDGVGDACDPSAAPESFALFDPFVGSAFGLRWTWNGTVTVGGSLARLDGRGGGAPYVGYDDVPGMTEVVVTGTVLDLDAGSVLQLSVQFGELTNSDAEYCEVYGAGTQLKIMRGVGATFTSIDEVAIPALAPGPFVLRFRHSAAGFWCELTTGGQTHTAAGAATYSEPRSFTYMQFASMLVTVDSFVEIDLP